MKKENNYDFLLKKYDISVPRYTSYPTAPHFNEEITSSQYCRFLAKLDPAKSVSLYFHIPFCEVLCNYCGCFTRIVSHKRPVDTYVEYLKKEIDMTGKHIGKKLDVSHIHFGGGSPNILTPENTKILFSTIGENFNVLDNAEIAMELDPRLLGDEKIDAYTKQGVNRASLGIQAFQPDVQKAINRIQPYKMVKECVTRLKKSGIEHINFDMIYGLPLQTVTSVLDDMEKVTSLKPDRIALFGYAHVPWVRPHQKQLEKHSLPGTMERFKMFEESRYFLIKNGYTAIGIDHFALKNDSLSTARKTGKLHRNFQGYTTDTEKTLIGFGISSINSFPDAYIQKETVIRKYKEKLEKDEFPILRGKTLTRQDKFTALIIEELMCYFETDIDKIRKKHGIPPDMDSKLSTSFQKLEKLEKDGLVKITDSNHIKITEAGRPFARIVASCLDEYFKPDEKMKHAKAV